MAFNFHRGPQKIDDIVSQLDTNADTMIDLKDNQIDLNVSGSKLFSFKPNNAELTGSLIISGPSSPNYALRIVSGDLELSDGIRLEAGSSGQFLMFNSGGNSQLQAVSGHMLFKVSSTRRYEFDLGGSGSTDIFRVRDSAANTKLSVDGTGTTLLSGSLTITPPSVGSGQAIWVSGSNTIGGSNYVDFIKATNNVAGAVTPSKTFRLNNSGTFEIINNAYSNVIYSLDDVGNMSTAGGMSIGGASVVGEIAERMVTSTAASGTVTFDTLNESIFFNNGPTGNITANFTNMSTTSNRATSVTVILSQSATPRTITTVQINGTGSTINWANKVIPTANANQYDVFGFNLIRSGSNWITFGQMSTYG